MVGEGEVGWFGVDGWKGGSESAEEIGSVIGRLINMRRPYRFFTFHG